MLKKIMFGIIVLLMLVLTTSAAFAGGDVLLDNMTSHLKADILVINEDVDNAISLQRWDLTADGSGLSTLTSITEATLCLYIYNVDVPGTLDDDVEVCQVNPIFVSEVSYNNFAFCSDYDNGANLTLSSTTENTTTCINITSVLEDWDGSSDFGLRFFDPDNHEQESDINVFAYDDAGLAIGLSNGTGSYDFEDRELSRGSGNVTTLNISYNYKPVLSSVVVTPATPDSADDLTCTPTATDNESDTITYTYAWYANDALTSYTTSTIDSTTKLEGKTWYCVVNASDRYGTSTGLQSNTVTVATSGGGTPSGGGLPPSPGVQPVVPGIVAENATFVTVPRDVTDILINVGSESSIKVGVMSTSNQKVSTKLQIVDECGIYDGYDVDSVEIDTYATIDPFQRITYELFLDVPTDFQLEKCDIFVTFLTKSGNKQTLQARVWNTPVSRFFVSVWRVIRYPIVFKEDAEFEFLNKDALATIPSVTSFEIPFVGLAILIVSFLIFKYVYYKYVYELRDRKRQSALFVISIVSTGVIGVLMSLLLKIH